MKGTMINLVRLINDVNGLISPMINITDNLVGNNSFYTLINCKFIGNDINNVIQSFSNGFSGSAKNLGVLIVVIAFLNAVMIIATIFMINFALPPVQTGTGISPVADTELKHLS